MNNLPLIGDNRTGIARAPERTEEMVRGNDEFAPTGRVDDRSISDVRQSYSKEGVTLGTLPPPASVKQVGKTAIGVLKKGSPNLFVDKLGERLAFERTGTRLYQALISKFEAFGSFEGGPTANDLANIMAEEMRHFLMLQRAIEKVGADPTAVTPSAEVQSTASLGLPAVLVDPRTNLMQSLEAILVAELVDNECWDALVELAEKAGEEELVRDFTQAQLEEREHLRKVRTWIAAGQGRPGAI